MTGAHPSSLVLRVRAIFAPVDTTSKRLPSCVKSRNLVGSLSKNVLILAATLSLPTALHADPISDRAEAALGVAQTFDTFTQDAAEAVIPFGVTEDPPQAGMNETQLETQGLAKTTDTSTVEGHGYQTINGGISDWNPDDVTGSLNLSDIAHANPASRVDSSMFHTPTGGACTATSFSEVPAFERSCERERVVYNSQCTERPYIHRVHSKQTFECTTIGVGLSCSEPLMEPRCEAVETICDEYHAQFPTVCLQNTVTYECRGFSQVNFGLPQVGPTVFGDPDIRTQRICSGNYDPVACLEAERSCTLGAGVISANGFNHPVSCREEAVDYECGTPYYTDNCSVFENEASCQQIREECFVIGEDGVCGNYDVAFRCGVDQVTSTYAACDDIHACVSGTCFDIPQDPNIDAAPALAHVSLLNTMANENTMKGRSILSEQCRRDR